MNVKNIAKSVASLVNNEEVVTALQSESTIPSSVQSDIDLIVNCINLTLTNIASNYVRLYACKEVTSVSKLIQYSDLCDNTINDIVSIKTKWGEPVPFTVTPTGIVVKNGVFDVKFTYFPESVGLNDTIVDFKTKINDMVIIYGAVSEYLYAKGVYDDAVIWEDRFKTQLSTLTHIHKQVKLKNRDWV